MMNKHRKEIERIMAGVFEGIESDAVIDKLCEYIDSLTQCSKCKEYTDLVCCPVCLDEQLDEAYDKGKCYGKRGCS